jgi:lipopolysaccharide/colanic/teichoic acid biosynthesis glycosyltransferase
MPTFKHREPLLLLVGDVTILIFALWLSLFLRSFEFPGGGIFLEHLAPFSLLFTVWVLVYYVAGLYDKHTLVLRSQLFGILFNTQIISSFIGVLFFYFTPFVGIAPKTLLVFFVFISFVLLSSWRLYGRLLIGPKKREQALLISSGGESKDLWHAINSNKHYDIEFFSMIDAQNLGMVDFDEEVTRIIYGNNITTIVIDLKDSSVAPILPKLYNLIFCKIKFIDMYRVYEDVFDRIPLSLVGYSWFLENISSSTHIGYDFLKRVMDFVVGGVLALVSLLLYLPVILAIWLEDRGAIFVFQDRVGRSNIPIRIAKFRTMNNPVDKQITRVGKFLRASRIDEVPQLWSVLSGSLSLVGPRPELPDLVAHYEREIPYYSVRHLIKPGLSGWAQIKDYNAPRMIADVEKTKNKLSYDLYYLKNRSFILDLKIALRTLKTLVSRSGA